MASCHAIAWRSTELSTCRPGRNSDFRQFKVLHGGNERALHTSRRGVFLAMCGFRSGEPSSHHGGPRSPSARLTSSTAFVRGTFSLPVGFSRTARRAATAGRRVQFAQPHRDRDSPCATACRGRRIATVRCHRVLHDMLCRLPLRLGRWLLRRASLAGFLPAIGISISF